MNNPDTKSVGTPSLTVRAMAEMLRLPEQVQARILHEQKYPKQGAQAFRVPYYQKAISGIRHFYKAGNNEAEIKTAMNTIQSIGQPARRENNARVLESFLKADIAKKSLKVLPLFHYKSHIGTVELRLSPDLHVLEENAEHILFLNCRAAKMDEEVARLTSEIAHLVLETNGIKLPIANIEYIDLFTGVIYRINQRRTATTKSLMQSIKAIEDLWPTL